MGKQNIWFETDLGFLKTKDLLLEKYRDQLSGDMADSKGRLHFHLSRYKDVTFQITTTGKLGIYFPEGIDYEEFLEQIKPVLVKADGTPVEKFKKISEPKSLFTIEEADREEVERCTKAVSKALKDGNKHILSSRVDQLKQLSERNRIAHFSQVLPTINELKTHFIQVPFPHYF